MCLYGDKECMIMKSHNQYSAQRGKIMDYLENVEECFIIRSVFQMRHCLFHTERLCENVITDTVS